MANINDIPLLERPQEKLKFFGEEFLSDSELLSIIINSGTKGKSSLEIAQELINYNNGLRFLIDSSIEELCKTAGIGKVKAIQLKAIGEITKRISKPISNRIKIKSRKDVVNLISTDLMFSKNEVLKLILLNNQNDLIKVKTIAVGSESNIILNAKLILREAIKCFAPKIILVHNHPSGNPKPSTTDIEFTNRIKEASKLIDIELLDHIIVSENGFECI